MDNGLKDFIEELRGYANARRGELAGMILEAANRLEEQAEEIKALQHELYGKKLEDDYAGADSSGL